MHTTDVRRFHSLDRAQRTALRCALVHVGVRKTASSYLQAWFANHDGCMYTTAAALAELALREARPEVPLDALLGHMAPRDVALRVNRDAAPHRRFVISNERFAMWAFGAEQFSRDFCERYLRQACALLHRTCPEGRVLIVTRGPQSWLSSAYHQHLRWPARVRSFKAFVHGSWAYLSTNLNYHLIHDIYASAFGAERVLMLPQELLRDNAERFLGVITSFAGLEGETSAAFADRPRNVSFSNRDMERLRRLRTLLRVLERDSRRPELDNEFRGKVLRGRSIDDFLGDLASCFLYEANPRVVRIVRVALDNMPEPAPEHCERTIPLERLDELTRGCRFLADRPEYRDYGQAYLANR